MQTVHSPVSCQADLQTWMAAETAAVLTPTCMPTQHRQVRYSHCLTVFDSCMTVQWIAQWKLVCWLVIPDVNKKLSALKCKLLMLRPYPQCD